MTENGTLMTDVIVELFIKAAEQTLVIIPELKEVIEKDVSVGTRYSNYLRLQANAILDTPFKEFHEAMMKAIEEVTK